MIIGKFVKKTDKDLIFGTITTLGFEAKGYLSPVENPASERSPVYRIYARGGTEVGAVFPRTTREGKDSLSYKLDDPSFPAPIYGTLSPDNENPDVLLMIWSRDNNR